MSNQETLQIFERDNTLTPRKLRSIGYVPATLYGKNFTPLSIQVKAHDFQLAWARGVRQFKLEGAGHALNAEVKQVQQNNVKDDMLHIEFWVPVSDAGKSKPAAAQPAQAVSPEPVAV